MPKIAAPTVAQHVAQQERAVIAAATRLFAERGVNNVSLAEIGAEVGLARNSLYRYFPDKGHILAAWFRAELAPLVEACADIAATGEGADAKLDAWLSLQLDYLVAPEHQAMLSAAAELTNLPEDVRADIGAGHRELYSSLGTIVAERLGLGEAAASGRAHSLTMFVVGLLRSASDLIQSGHDRVHVREQMLRSAHAILDS